MIELSRGSRLRVRCDADLCERFFAPRRPIFDLSFDAESRAATRAAIRERAELYGWTVVPDALVFSDLCPEHSR